MAALETPSRRRMSASKNTTLPTPTKSILRTIPTNADKTRTSGNPKTSGKTRTIAEAGLDDTNSADEKPSKRRRVEFDLENNTVTDVTKINRIQIKSEVKLALEDHENGDNERYDRLKERFAPAPSFEVLGDDADNPPDIRIYLSVLTGFGRHLNRSCAGLVMNVLQMPWMHREDAFVQTYTQFLASLLLTQGPTYTQMVLRMLVEKFLERNDGTTFPRDPSARNTARQNVHNILQYTLQHFPLAGKTLRIALVDKFPFPDDSKRTHLAYISNLLRLHAYSKELRQDIMDLVIDKLLQIDVRMQLNLEDLDDTVTSKVVLAIQQDQDKKRDGDEEDEESDTDSISDDEDDKDEEAELIYNTKSNIEKMDAILDLLFEFFTPMFANPSSDEAFAVYSSLIGDFGKLILPTYKSRHTQFLLFHFSQQSERLMDAFCGTCISFAFQPSQPVMVRQAAAAYLASFVARGAHVPRHIIRSVFEVVGLQLDELRQRHEESCRWPDLEKYGNFYAFFQALLYVFCFRWRDLVESVPDTVDEDDPLSYLNQDIEWVHGVRETLRAAIYSKMNPLKVCAPVIVEEFAKLSRRLNFLYVNPLLETNKRIRLSHFATARYSSYSNGMLRDSGIGTHKESKFQMEPYFPFDPYQLPVSKRWVDSDYMEWQGFPGVDEGADGNDSDHNDSGSEEDQDDDEGGDTESDEDEDEEDEEMED